MSSMASLLEPIRSHCVPLHVLEVGAQKGLQKLQAFFYVFVLVCGFVQNGEVMG